MNAKLFYEALLTALAGLACAADTVYLNDGTEASGTIIEESAITVVIKRSNGALQSFRRSDVDAVVYEKKAPGAPANLTPPDADWPQWRGPDRTGVAHNSPPLASAWPDSGPKKVWEVRPVRAYAGGYGCPVVAAQGRAYMFIHDKAKTREMVVCLNARTGSTIWIQQFTSRETMHNASGTPCVVKGRLYVTGARVSYCLDAMTGALLWKQDTGVPAQDPAVNKANQEVSSSFIVVNDIAATMLGPCHGLNTQTGNTVWTAPESGGYSGAMTSPVRWMYNGKAYLVYCGKWRMCCVEADNGTVLWDVHGNKTGKGYAPTPSLVGDDLAVYWRGKLGAYHLTDAGPKLLWEVEYFDPYSSPILDNGRVYAAGRQQDGKDTSLTCYDLATGNPRWVCSIPDPEYSSPILADGKLIVLGDKGKRLILVDALTGKLLANVPINGKRWSSPALANGLLYVRLADDGLACYDLTCPRR
ncbi:MAG: PQQ-binding-like beta-propeller repeat protein [Planctomycetota bacterium]